jgi:hypothetical protein
MTGKDSAAGEGRPLKTRVEWMDAGDPPANDAIAAIAFSNAGGNMADRYRKGRRSLYGVDMPVSFILRLEGLNSPDSVLISGIERTDKRIDLRLSVKRFSGLLGANVVRTALVEIELGILAPGDYECRIAIDNFTFSDWDQPETARFSETEIQRHTFAILP